MAHVLFEHTDGDPPWGQQREALTAAERTNLLLLIGSCLICDVVFSLLLAGLLG